jgi:hypothetical protein
LWCFPPVPPVVGVITNNIYHSSHSKYNKEQSRPFPTNVSPGRIF